MLSHTCSYSKWPARRKFYAKMDETINSVGIASQCEIVLFTDFESLCNPIIFLNLSRIVLGLLSLDATIAFDDNERKESICGRKRLWSTVDTFCWHLQHVGGQFVVMLFMEELIPFTTLNVLEHIARNPMFLFRNWKWTNDRTYIMKLWYGT